MIQFLKQPISKTSAKFSPVDSNRLAVARADGFLHVLDIRRPKRLVYFLFSNFIYVIFYFLLDILKCSRKRFFTHFAVIISFFSFLESLPLHGGLAMPNYSADGNRIMCIERYQPVSVYDLSSKKKQLGESEKISIPMKYTTGRLFFRWTGRRTVRFHIWWQTVCHAITIRLMPNNRTSNRLLLFHSKDTRAKYVLCLSTRTSPLWPQTVLMESLISGCQTNFIHQHVISCVIWSFIVFTFCWINRNLDIHRL